MRLVVHFKQHLTFYSILVLGLFMLIVSWRCMQREYDQLRAHTYEIMLVYQEYQQRVAKLDALIADHEQKITPTNESVTQSLLSVVADLSTTDTQENVSVVAIKAKKTSTSGAQKTKPTIKQSSWPSGMWSSAKPFQWPIERENFWLSSHFGRRKGPRGVMQFHYGIDMASIKGTPVYAAGAGRVIRAGYESGYGNTILIKHSPLYQTRYAHLDTIAVKKGQIIKQGARIGTVGDTGFTRKSGTNASHLHFEVCKQGRRVNPLSLLPA